MYHIGQKVYSKYFGEGKVISTTCTTYGEMYPIQVQFSANKITFTTTGLNHLDYPESDKNLLHKILKPRKASNDN